jgi:uncharacterized protein (DUF1015 family)
MRLYAFEGIHYTPRAGEAGELAAPPYDQINDTLRDRFHVQSPYQFVHLSKPVAPEGGDPYRFAAALHHRWLKDGIIARDPRPAIYPYVIELSGGSQSGGGERLGVLGLVRYEDPAVIRPHEQTLAKPLADRTALLEAMRVDLEPVLLLSEDRGRLDALLREDLQAAQPLVRHRDADGHVHAVYRIDDPARIARYREALDVPAAIADGHHRYKVGQRFAQEHGAAPDTAAAAKLAVVTSLDSPALTIDPIHRAFKEPVDLSRLAGVARISPPPWPRRRSRPSASGCWVTSRRSGCSRRRSWGWRSSRTRSSPPSACRRRPRRTARWSTAPTRRSCGARWRPATWAPASGSPPCSPPPSPPPSREARCCPPNPPGSCPR